MDSLMDTIVHQILTALAPVIAATIVAILVQFLRKLNLDLGAEQQAKVEKIVHDGVFLAQEKVARAAKMHMAPVGTKLGIAVEHVLEKMPGITSDEAKELVHQELPKLGLGASGFTGAVVTAATTGPK